MGVCIQGQDNNIAVNAVKKGNKRKRRISSIENLMDPKLCRWGTTDK
jgi:hypothetical protein